MRPRRVVYPYSSPGPGGSQVLPAQLARFLRGNSAWEVDICLSTRGANAVLFETPGYAPHDLKIPPIRADAGFRTLRRLKVYGAAWYLRTYGRALPYLRRHRPDLIHVHHAPDLFTWGLMGKLLGIPVLWHVHTYHAKRLDRRHFRFCDRAVFVSEASRSHFEGAAALPPHSVVHNGIDTAHFAPADDAKSVLRDLGLAPDRLTLGFVGQLTGRKRPEWAVQAALDLLDAGHDLQLLVVGADRSPDQAHRRRIEEMVAAAGRGDRIRLIEHRADVAPLMRALDVFLFTSEALGEAFPLVVLEAMASQVAVVATRSAGVPEAVRDGDTGWLASADDYGDFVRQVASAAACSASRAARAQAARLDACARFSIERCGTEVVALYERMVDGPATRDAPNEGPPGSPDGA